MLGRGFPRGAAAQPGSGRWSRARRQRRAKPPLPEPPLDQQPRVLCDVARPARGQHVADRVPSATRDRHDVIHLRRGRRHAAVRAAAPVAPDEPLPVPLRHTDAVDRAALLYPPAVVRRELVLVVPRLVEPVAVVLPVLLQIPGAGRARPLAAALDVRLAVGPVVLLQARRRGGIFSGAPVGGLRATCPRAIALTCAAALAADCLVDLRSAGRASLWAAVTDLPRPTASGLALTGP